MNRFVNAVRECLAAQNWYGALALALTLPDICGKLQDSGEPSSRKRYVRWFDQYLATKYRLNVGGMELVFLTGADCYALRCSFLHGGADDITDQQTRDVLSRFFFTTQPKHLIRVADTLTVNVTRFCEEICSAVDQWSADHAADENIQLRLDGMLRIHTTDFSPVPGVRIGD